MGSIVLGGDEWFLQGHFPGNPVVPGVVLCEIMAQTCCILLKEELVGKTPYYTGIDRARFKNVRYTRAIHWKFPPISPGKKGPSILPDAKFR